MQIDVSHVVGVAQAAALEILNVYSGIDFVIKSKADNSPLTLADKKSRKVIFAELTSAYPEIPFLSEEQVDLPAKIGPRFCECHTKYSFLAEK